jgi:predicted SnoaL-like aldol condensation-catalyzing enzyme
MLHKEFNMPETEVVNAATGFSHDEMKQFVRNHFEEFVNRKNIGIGEVNFAPEFVDHGADVPPGTPPGPAGAMQYVGSALKKLPDMQVTIEDIIAEGDRVVVRNTWRATNPENGEKVKFSGIVIWRIAHRQLAERWAYLEAPHPA